MTRPVARWAMAALPLLASRRAARRLVPEHPGVVEAKAGAAYRLSPSVSRAIRRNAARRDRIVWAQRHAGAPWHEPGDRRARHGLLAGAGWGAVVFVAVRLLASCASVESTPGTRAPGCVDNPFAATQQAQRDLGLLQQGAALAQQAPYVLQAGPAGWLGMAQQGLGDYAGAQAPVTAPCPPTPRRRTP